MVGIALSMVLLFVLALLFLRQGFLFKLMGYALLFMAGVAPILPVVSRWETMEATGFDLGLLFTGLLLIGLCLVKGSQGFAQVGRDFSGNYNPQ